ncbi:MAG: seg [Candidatus Magasanikbacteria bacterium]|nr:seg [Candidatus Magasanikbacteria bacterium]
MLYCHRAGHCIQDMLTVTKKARFEQALAKLLLFCFISLIFGAYLLHPNVVQAQTTGSASQDSFCSGWGDIFCGIFSGLVKFFVFFLNLLQQLLSHLVIWAFRSMIALTAYNDYLAAPVVQEGWLIVRDIANMGFVIALLIISFATILGIQKYAIQSTALRFLGAAIFINFSKTIIGLMIDAAQVFMHTFVAGYQQIAGGNLIKLLQADKWFNLSAINQLTGGGTASEISAILSPLVGHVFGILIALAALTAGLIYLGIIIGRIITLWFLIIISPLAFFATVLPYTQKYSSQFWSKLGSQIIVGPLIAFVLWLALSVVQASPDAFELTCSPSVNSAFATCGPTDYYKELGGNPTITDTGIGEWNRMATFVIALGFLLGGAKLALNIAGGIGKVIAEKLTGVAKQYVEKPALAATKFAMVTAPLAAGKFVGKGVAAVATGTSVRIPQALEMVGARGAAAGFERFQARQRERVEAVNKFLKPKREEAQALAAAQVRGGVEAKLAAQKLPESEEKEKQLAAIRQKAVSQVMDKYVSEKKSQESAKGTFATSSYVLTKVEDKEAQLEKQKAFDAAGNHNNVEYEALRQGFVDSVIKEDADKKKEAMELDTRIGQILVRHPDVKKLADQKNLIDEATGQTVGELMDELNDPDPDKGARAKYAKWRENNAENLKLTKSWKAWQKRPSEPEQQGVAPGAGGRRTTPPNNDAGLERLGGAIAGGAAAQQGLGRLGEAIAGAAKEKIIKQQEDAYQEATTGETAGARVTRTLGEAITGAAKVAKGMEEMYSETAPPPIEPSKLSSTPKPPETTPPPQQPAPSKLPEQPRPTVAEAPKIPTAAEISKVVGSAVERALSKHASKLRIEIKEKITGQVAAETVSRPRVSPRVSMHIALNKAFTEINKMPDVSPAERNALREEIQKELIPERKPPPDGSEFGSK